MGIVGYLMQGVVPVIDELFKTTEQGLVGRSCVRVELPLIQAGEEEEEDMKIAFQHAPDKSVWFVVPGRILRRA